MEAERGGIGWVEGSVNRAVQHFVISYGSGCMDEGDIPETPVALVGPPIGGRAIVEFLVDKSDLSTRESVDAVVGEIDFYLTELGDPNPWRYCLLHTGTLSNAFSRVHWECHMSGLEHEVVEFELAARRFRGFGRRGFTVGELLSDRRWDWGVEHGVYCFLVGDEVVYVGRALGCTLGERIADQLRQKSDPEWAAVVEDDASRIELFTVEKDRAYIAAALEAYLIQVLAPHPKFNSRLC